MAEPSDYQWMIFLSSLGVASLNLSRAEIPTLVSFLFLTFVIWCTPGARNSILAMLQFNSRELLSVEDVFCPSGKLFALSLLQANYRAAASFGTIEIDILKRAIDDAFEELRVHWLTCAKCNEDDWDAHDTSEIR